MTRMFKLARKYASIIAPNYEKMVSKVIIWVENSTMSFAYHTLVCIDTAKEHRRNVVLLYIKPQWRHGLQRTSRQTTQTICVHRVSFMVTA